MKPLCALSWILLILVSTNSSAEPFQLSKFSAFEQNFIRYVAGGALEDAAMYESRISDHTFKGHGLLGAILSIDNPRGDGPCPWTRGIVYAMNWDKRHIGEASIVKAFRSPTREPSQLSNRRGSNVITMCTMDSSIQSAVRLSLLVKAGANPNQPLMDSEATPPLHIAAMLRDSLFPDKPVSQPIVTNLVFAGATPDLRNKSGKTALMLIFEDPEYFDEATAQFLVWAGASVDAVDAKGTPVIGYILHPSRDRHSDIQLRKLRFLKRHGARLDAKIPLYREAEAGGGFRVENSTFLDAVLASGNLHYYRAAQNAIGQTLPNSGFGPESLPDLRAKTLRTRDQFIGSWIRTGKHGLLLGPAGTDKVRISEDGSASAELYGKNFEGWSAFQGNTLLFASFNGNNDFHCSLLEKSEKGISVQCSDRGKERWKSDN